MSDPILVIGVDPGPAKEWAFHTRRVAREGSHCVPSKIDGPCWPERGSYSPRDFIEKVVESHKASTKLLVVVDCPVIHPTSVGHWLVVSRAQLMTETKLGTTTRKVRIFHPFDVSPFCQRPAERLLAVPPPNGQAAGSDVSALWDFVKKKMTHGFLGAGAKKNLEVKHEGCSVQGFSGVTHWAAFKTVLRELRHRLGKDVPVLPSPDAALVHPLSILEAHPAVYMVTLADAGKLDPITVIPKYKPHEDPEEALFTDRKRRAKEEDWKKNEEVFNGLCRVCRRFGQAQHEAVVVGAPRFRGDDDLDAFICLLAGLDVVAGRADWIGDAEDGYFFVAPDARRPYATAYARAKAEVKALLAAGGGTAASVEDASDSPTTSPTTSRSRRHTRRPSNPRNPR